jgi:hypothetical protein
VLPKRASAADDNMRSYCVTHTEPFLSEIQSPPEDHVWLRHTNDSGLRLVFWWALNPNGGKRKAAKSFVCRNFNIAYLGCEVN